MQGLSVFLLPGDNSVLFIIDLEDGALNCTVPDGSDATCTLPTGGSGCYGENCWMNTDELEITKLRISSEVGALWTNGTKGCRTAMQRPGAVSEKRSGGLSELWLVNWLNKLWHRGPC